MSVVIIIVLIAMGGFSPLDHQLELVAKHWSEGVTKLVVWLSGMMGSFERVAEVLGQVGEVAISDSTVWRLVAERGERIQAAEMVERAKANALPSRGDIGRDEISSSKRMGVSMDGTMINIRREGWKELKVGCVFEVEERPTLDEASGEEIEMGHGANSSYLPHLGGPILFGQGLWAEAKRRGWERAWDTVVVADGAPWIWNLAAEHFYDSEQIVDWYHATEHLAKAAALLHGEGTTSSRYWYKSRKTTLFQGHADLIAQELAKAAKGKPQVAEDLVREAGYFKNNSRRMQYLERREEGYPIGSGTVESGAKQFKARFSGPGMRWSRAGAERLLPIRAAIMSRRFDKVWHLACNSPPN